MEGKKKLRKFGRAICSAMDQYSASPCFRVTAAGDWEDRKPHCDGGKRDECPWRGEVCSRREIASQLAHAANANPLSPGSPRRRGARSPGPSFPRPYRD